MGRQGPDPAQRQPYHPQIHPRGSQADHHPLSRFARRCRRATEVVGEHDDLPPGLSAADNEAGWRESLAKLAALVETDQ